MSLAPAIWGPSLWTLLHGGVEKMGRTTNPAILADQRREFLWILHFVEFIMPCPVCRSHYHEWRIGRPAEKLSVSEFQAAIRQWLNEFHRSIAILLGRPGAAEAALPKPPLPLATGELLRILGEFLEMLRPIPVDRAAVQRFKTHYELFLRFCL